MATLIQREVRKRGFFGKVIKYLFIAFNLFMAWWLFAGLAAVGGTMSGMTSDAERVGGAIGTAVGAGFVLFIWVVGDIILGMLTYFSRGTKILITEDTN